MNLNNLDIDNISLNGLCGLLDTLKYQAETQLNNLSKEDRNKANELLGLVDKSNAEDIKKHLDKIQKDASRG